MAAPVRGRGGHHRALAGAGRRVLLRDRRARSGLRAGPRARPGGTRLLPAEDVLGVREIKPRYRLVARDGTAALGGDARRSTGRDGRRRGPARRRAPAYERECRRSRDPAAGVAGRRGAAEFAAAAGRGAVRPGDSVRQRREPDAGALHATRSRVCSADGGRRRTRPPAAATVGRERRDRGPGRRRRLRLRHRLARGGHGVHAGRRAASGAGRRELSAPRVRCRPRRVDYSGLRDGARAARRPAERPRPAPRAAHRRQRGTAAAAPGVGGGGSRPGAGAAGRRGPARAELRAPGEPRPGLRSGEHDGAAGVSLSERRAGGHRQLLPRDPRRHPRAAGCCWRGSSIGLPVGIGGSDAREFAAASGPGAVSTGRGAVGRRLRRDARVPRRDGHPSAGRPLVRRS